MFFNKENSRICATCSKKRCVQLNGPLLLAQGREDHLHLNSLLKDYDSRSRAMAGRGLLLSCIKSSSDGDGDCCSFSWRLLPKPRYPSMPKYPKKGSKFIIRSDEDDLEDSREEEKEKKVALFSVIGMTCSACAGSVEKAIKRLPGIHDAAVDVLNNRAQVIFYPAFVNVSF